MVSQPSAQKMSLWATGTPVNGNYANPKILVCDIQFSLSGNPAVVVSSATFQILVYRDVTR